MVISAIVAGWSLWGWMYADEGENSSSNSNVNAPRFASAVPGLSRLLDFRRPPRMAGDREASMTQTAETDSVAAIARTGDAWKRLLMHLDDGQPQSDMIDRFLDGRQEINFSDALEWAKGLPAGELQQRALIHLSYRWEQADLAGALSFAQSLPEGQDQLLVLLMESWAVRQPQEASTWLASLSDGPRKEKLTPVLLGAWTTEAPEAAAGFVTTLPPGERQRQSAAVVASRWATQDPVAAASWAATLPPGRTRLYAIEVIANEWARGDRAGASGWILQLPAGPSQDAALSAMAGALLPHQPETAAKLANGILDGRLREFQLERTIRQWMQINPAAATAWVNASNNLNR